MKHHRLLQRQLKKLLSDYAENPSTHSLLSAVSDAYDQSDRDREQLERSMDLTSKELTTRNRELKKQLSELEKTQNALQESHSLLHASLNSTYEALFVLDLKGNVRLYNPNFSRMFKVNQEQDPVSHLEHFFELTRSLISSPDKLFGEIHYSLKHPDHKSECEFKTEQGRTIEAYSSPQWLKSDIVGQVWSFRDVTELKLKEEEARHRAYHDLLTGLPNRRLLSVRLNHALLETNASQGHIIVLFIDLDGFKDVNDSLGHRVGDALLKEVSQRLESRLPTQTMLARHGGDEFIAVMEHQPDTTLAIKFSTDILDSFSDPFQLSDDEIYMSASIGIAMSPEHGDEADKLISHADIAMYQAKQSGKNTFEIYKASKDSRSSHRLKIRNQLNIAIEQNQFELFFQPKISLESGTIKGAEALIRWRASNGEYRSPIEFIPIAEENGQIIPISQWVIQRCCEYLQKWQPHLEDDFVLALNISAKHFQRGLLTDDMKTALSKMDIEPSKLELEVTETAIMDDVDLAVQTLNELKQLGIRTAIDDFGTGHSSLSYLRKLPIEILKIDKSFIDEILISKEDRTLVKGIIDMVHALGIEVVAEGVENHQMAELLHEMNCDLVQGYHYCRPIPEAEFLNLIKSQQCYI